MNAKQKASTKPICGHPQNGQNQPCKTPTETLIAALRILAAEIQSDDGVANAAIAEAADRLQENADLLLSCCELIEAVDGYEWSVDDPPTHREMMLRAMRAVEIATICNASRSES